jgi:hydrogenase maturation protease
LTAKKNEALRILVIGYGNPGRQDDGLGPALAAAVEELAIPGLDVDSDYQLMIEHASDIAEHDVVIFADADISGPEPFGFKEIKPAKGIMGLTSHSMEAEEAMAMAEKMFGTRPRGFALGIRGYRFNDFGEELSDKAKANLAAAVTFVEKLIRDGLDKAAISFAAN